MNILEELVAVFTTLQISVETGVFSGKAPDEYVVLTPLADTFIMYADNKPRIDTQETRISLYSKGNYIRRKDEIVTDLLDQDFVVSNRSYIGHEDDTGYHHYSIDVEKHYEIEG